MTQPDPVASLDRIQAFVRPDAEGPARVVEDWQPPEFGSYEALKDWLKEAVLHARLYEAYPDGQWTVDLLLKEQTPGTTYRMRL